MEYVLFIDADMDIHPNQIPNIVDIMSKTHSDIVVASKKHPEFYYSWIPTEKKDFKQNLPDSRKDYV